MREGENHAAYETSTLKCPADTSNIGQRSKSRGGGLRGKAESNKKN